MRIRTMQAILLIILLATLGGCCWRGNCGPTPPRGGQYSSDQRSHRPYREARHHHDRDREVHRDRHRDRDDWRRRYDPSRDGYHEEDRR